MNFHAQCMSIIFHCTHKKGAPPIREKVSCSDSSHQPHVTLNLPAHYITYYLIMSLLKGPSGVDNRSPLHFLLGYGVNVAPAKMLTLHLSLQTPSPSLLWTPRSPPACWIPSECLPSDVTLLLPQCVSQPRPLSSSYLYLNRLLVCPLPQLPVGYYIWPVDS